MTTMMRTCDDWKRMQRAEDFLIDLFGHHKKGSMDEQASKAFRAAFLRIFVNSEPPGSG